ncbi:MAG: substrate-binding periplasmic protein [Aeromonadaceae bacterium]
MYSAQLLRHLLLSLVIVASHPINAETIEVYALEAMPYCGIEQGKATGLAVEILQAASRHGAPQFRFHFDVPWLRAQEMIQRQSNPLSAIIPFSRTPSRETRFNWLARLFFTQSRFYSYLRPAPLSAMDEAKLVKIGVVRGHALIDVLQHAGITRLDTGSIDAENNLRKLYHKRFDTIADSDLIVRYHWKKMGYPTALLQEGASIGASTGVYLAAGLHFPDDVSQRIQQAMNRLQASGELTKILARWQ